MDSKEEEWSGSATPPSNITVSVIDGRSDDPLPEEFGQLEEASGRGDLAMAEAILQSRWPAGLPADERSIREFSYSVLQAIDHDHYHLTAFLLSRGVPFEMKYAVRAVEKKSYKLMEMLLVHGWDINAQEGPLEPPLLKDTFCDRQLMEWFLSHGASPNAQCKFGSSPLSIAVAEAPLETIELLSEHGGSVDYGELLHHAAQRNGLDCTAVLQFLLEQGAEINRIEFSTCPFSFQWYEHIGLGTPLHYAARAGNEQAVRYLLEQGADPLIRDTRGSLPIDSARYYQHGAIVQVLESTVAGWLLKSCSRASPAAVASLCRHGSSLGSLALILSYALAFSPL